MSIIELHGSLLAIIAGFLEGDAKANFASACKTTRAASTAYAAEWWSGNDMRVTVTDDNIGSFVQWASAMAARGNTARINELCMCPTGSSEFMDKVNAMHLAPMALSPEFADIDWRTYYQLEKFTSVTHLVLRFVDCLQIHPHMLPPNVETLEIDALEDRWCCKVCIPPSVKNLFLKNIEVDKTSLAFFDNLEHLSLENVLVVGDDADANMWKQLNIKRMSIKMENVDDNEVNMDRDVPFKCYPTALQSLSFDVHRPNGNAIASMQHFTKEALRSIASLDVFMTGTYLGNSWSVGSDGGIVIDGMPFSHLKWLISVYPNIPHLI